MIGTLITGRLIHTTCGDVDEALLTKREGSGPAGVWVEYYLAGALVHRSVSVSLEQPIPLGAHISAFDRYGWRWTFTGMPPC
jgi:hypothetical protein